MFDFVVLKHNCASYDVAAKPAQRDWTNCALNCKEKKAAQHPGQRSSNSESNPGKARSYRSWLWMC